MYNFRLILLVISYLVINGSDSKKYNNYTLFRAVPVNQSHLDFFYSLDEIYEMNYWKEPGSLNKPVDLVIHPADRASFVNSAQRHGIYVTALVPDVQQLFDAQLVKHYTRKQMDSFDWKNFYNTDDIYEWLRDLSKSYPTELELKSIGQTFEGRHIMSAKIVLRGSQRRSKVMIEGGIHAREWISPAFVTYFLHQILTAPATDDEVLKSIALTYEWYFVPLLNPDGYEYTIKEDRLWRKNRRDYVGVDVNRNFGNHFGTVGVSHSKYSESYCGPHEFSEKESKAIKEFVEENSEQLEYYIAVHSYGQYMIIPYAFSSAHFGNYDELKTMCDHAALRIAKLYDTQYQSGNAYETVGYKTSGVSGDWAKEKFEIPYVIYFELRDTGHHGFALRTHDIHPTCEETKMGVLSLLTPRTETFERHSKNVESQKGNYMSWDLCLVLFDILLLLIVC